MKISYNWLSSYFADKLPPPEDVSRLLTMHSFEVESTEEKDGDFILDVKVLPDRAHDCLSHIGIAREVSLISGTKIKQLFHPIDLPETDKVDITVENPHEAVRFTTLLIEGIKVGESPEWMKKFLSVLGLKSINNVVDAANLCMLHTGQPLHTYDAGKLTMKDGKWHLSTRMLSREEVFHALDNKDYKLLPEMLTIRDVNAEKTLGIAGIKGGVESRIDEKTETIIVEAANFNSTRIRKTSQKLRLRTDASERFEKEITPELTRTSLGEFATLIKEMMPEAKIIGIKDIYPKRRNPYLIGVSISEINRKLGLNLSHEEVRHIFNRLNFHWEVVKPVDKVLSDAPGFVGVPYKYGTSISYDVPKTFDCSAFVAYLYARAGIALPRITVDQFLYGENISKDDLRPGDVLFAKNGTEEIGEFEIIATGEKVKQAEVHKKSVELSGLDIPEGVEHCGIYLGDGKVIHASGKKYRGEVVIENISESPSFKDVRGYRRFSNNEERYVVTVPPERLDLMSKRAFLVSGNKEDLIEEIGRVYGYESIPSVALPETNFKPKVEKELYYTNKLRDELISVGYSEVMTYAFVNKGDVEIANPLASDKKFLRSSMIPLLEKAYKENNVNKDLLGVKEIKIFEIGKVFKDGKEILMIAKMPDKTEENLEEYISKQPYQDRYDFTQGVSSGYFSSISPYPFVTRDVAVFVPLGTGSEELEKIIRENGTHLLVKTYLFDEFVKDEKLSYAFRLVFQAEDRTLTQDEVNVIMSNIWSKIEERGWNIR